MSIKHKPTRSITISKSSSTFKRCIDRISITIRWAVMISRGRIKNSAKWSSNSKNNSWTTNRLLPNPTSKSNTTSFTWSSTNCPKKNIICKVLSKNMRNRSNFMKKISKLSKKRISTFRECNPAMSLSYSIRKTWTMNTVNRRLYSQMVWHLHSILYRREMMNSPTRWKPWL